MLSTHFKTTTTILSARPSRVKTATTVKATSRLAENAGNAKRARFLTVRASVGDESPLEGDDDKEMEVKPFFETKASFMSNQSAETTEEEVEPEEEETEVSKSASDVEFQSNTADVKMTNEEKNDEKVEGFGNPTPNPGSIDSNPPLPTQASLKSDLLATVAGLDRGFAATPIRIARVRDFVERLETSCGIVSLSWNEVPGTGASLDVLDGIWRLVYSSAFDNGNLGGRQPGPLSVQLSATPFSLGQIYQKINVNEGTLDNIVELLASALPRPPWTPANQVPTIRLTLKHDFTVSEPNSVKLVFKDTTVEILNSGINIPPFEFPPVPPFVRQLSGRTSDGEFNVVYLDDSMRITEGDKGELRVFIRDDGASGLE